MTQSKDTFRFREGDMVTLGDRRGKVIGFTLAGGVYVQFQDAKAPALCQRWGLVVHERGPLKDTTEENPAATEATQDDVVRELRGRDQVFSLRLGAESIQRKTLECRAADEIERLRAREAYLVRELDACSDIPSGDKDGLE